jgi:peroxiredoxin
MISSRFALFGWVAGVGLSLLGAAVGRGNAQDEPPQRKQRGYRRALAGETLHSINDDYNRQLLQLERQRLERLGQLAGHQPPTDAAATYEMLFRLAIANNLFREAEPAAEEVLKPARSSSPVVQFLAQTINIIAEADRGAFQESLANLRKVIGSGSAGNRPSTEVPAGGLETPELLAICGAYYQRLIQGDQFDVARQAFQLVHDETKNPAVKEYCADRLIQLKLIGKSAPPIQGTDLDGKPVRPSDLKGKVSLVVFWASWCLPSSTEIAWLDQVYDTYRDRGFQILGINLDTLQSGAKLETAMPNIRRFLVDHNVRWPNLINGDGARDYAKTYGVTAIPTNVLIGRDGTVIHLDLSRKNLNQVVARVVSTK